MNVIIAGIQGSGKGTQSKLIAEKYGLDHISVGDCIYKYFTLDPSFVLPYTLEKYKSGELAPNDIVIKVASKEVNSSKGYILDGYPRQMAQLESIADFDSKIDMTIILDLTESQCYDRLIGRGRSDDTETGINKRISSYNTFTYPILQLLERYGNVYHIDTSKSVDDVFNEICDIIEKYKLMKI